MTKVTGASGKGFSAEVAIEGLPGTLAALKAFEPQVLRAMNREIRTVTRSFMGAAESNFAATGGGGGYRPSSSTRGKRVGMRVTAIGSTGSSGSDWSQRGALSAILEFYGKVQPGQTTRAQSCTKTLNERYGQPGRFLWSAWDSQKATAIPRIEAAVRTAEKQLQQTLDAQGVGY
jgi:hypothetical protein